MDQSNNYQKKAGEIVSGQSKESGKISSAAKAFRAVTAIVVFGIPLVAGVATLLSCAVHGAYKRMKGDS
jgi:hypothetical protein